MKRIVIVTASVVLLYCTCLRCEPLQIVTDFYPPFSYEENGEIKGISTRILKAVLKEAGLRATIRLYPFKRGYIMTRKRKNIFQYSVVKTPEREPEFKWVGIVGPAEQVLFAPKNSNIKIDKFENLKYYTIGTVYEDAVDQFLFSKINSCDLQLERISSYKLNMMKLMKGRFDLWAGNRLVGYRLVKEIGFDENDIKVAYAIKELTDDCYLVTGLQTSDDLVKKLSASFKTIHNNGVYQNIVNEYFSTK